MLSGQQTLYVYKYSLLCSFSVVHIHGILGLTAWDWVACWGVSPEKMESPTLGNP